MQTRRHAPHDGMFERGLPCRAARISAKDKVPILRCGPPGQRLANIPDQKKILRTDERDSVPAKIDEILAWMQRKVMKRDTKFV